MNLLDSFAQYLQTMGIATLGQNLFIGEAPSSNQVQDSVWWIIDSGGSPIAKNQTGESRKAYQITVFNRDRNYKTIKNAMFALEEQLNCDGCTQLQGFDTIDIEATTFPIDQDLDNEDRKIGMLQATITTYKEC